MHQAIDAILSHGDVTLCDGAKKEGSNPTVKITLIVFDIGIDYSNHYPFHVHAILKFTPFGLRDHIWWLLC